MNPFVCVILLLGSPALGLAAMFSGLGGKTVVLRRQRPRAFLALLIASGLSSVLPSIAVGLFLGELFALASVLPFSFLMGRLVGRLCQDLVKAYIRPPPGLDG
jgi:hypothetical protein